MASANTTVGHAAHRRPAAACLIRPLCPWLPGGGCPVRRLDTAHPGEPSLFSIWPAPPPDRETSRQREGRTHAPAPDNPLSRRREPPTAACSPAPALLPSACISLRRPVLSPRQLRGPRALATALATHPSFDRVAPAPTATAVTAPILAPATATATTTAVTAPAFAPALWRICGARATVAGSCLCCLAVAAS